MNERVAHPEVYLHIGVHTPHGVVPLYGLPSYGKTMLANAIAGEVGLPFIAISAPSVLSGSLENRERRYKNPSRKEGQHPAKHGKNCCPDVDLYGRSYIGENRRATCRGH
ncbi:hypothetical protein HOY82DRAFT_593165 [Tuber indicum]|nr:hypothetical protein HOY82DRAFT_593165 [Tuber indicum]